MVVLELTKNILKQKHREIAQIKKWNKFELLNW